MKIDTKAVKKRVSCDCVHREGRARDWEPTPHEKRLKFTSEPAGESKSVSSGE